MRQSSLDRLPSFNLSEQPVEGLAGEFVLFDGLFTAERGPNEGVDQGGGVDVGRDGKTIRALHDHQLLAQLFHTLANEDREMFQVNTKVHGESTVGQNLVALRCI